MAERSSLLAPIHILSYGTLLGAQSLQTFVSGIVAFKTLPRPQFGALQGAVFPIYFGIQTILPLVMAVSYPGEKLLRGYGPSSLSGVFADGHGFSTLLPIAVTFACGLSNVLVLQPLSSKFARERMSQQSIDGKNYHDPGPHSKEMIRLNKSFGRAHGASVLINLVAWAATVYYGITLADRIF